MTEDKRGKRPAGGGRRRPAGRDGRRPVHQDKTGQNHPKPPRSKPSDKGQTPRDDRPPRDTSHDLPWPDEIFDLELEPELRADLEAFGGRTETLAKHLLSVQVLAESDPEAAYLHAQRLRDRIPRSALARQTACIAAYRAGRFKEAVKEESAYRRISGRFDLVPIAADSERGLERAERALAMVTEFDGAELEPDTRTELYIVAGGARRDLGDDEAARVFLQKAVRAARSPMASARARYALGDLLLAGGDTDQARKWLQSAVEIDEDDVWTDAAGMLATLT